MNTSRLHSPVPSLAGIERLREGGRERDGFIPMDRNERLAPLPDAVLKEIRAALDSSLLTGYPVLDDLYEDLAQALRLPRERLLLTAGSDAAFRALCQAYVRPGDRIAMLDPSYAMYPIYARMFGAEPIAVAFERDLSLDAAALLEAAGAGPRMVMLAEPNQPTGTKLGEGLLREVLARAGETGALVVVNEAYFPFSHATVLPWVAEHDHLVVTRTFSKAWGLAGVRLGFVAAHPDVVANLYKVRSAYDVNAVAALCARTLLAHPEVADDFAAEVDAGRRVLAERASAIGLEALPSHTNFQLLRVGDPVTLAARLRDRGYLVRGPFAAPCLADCIRVTLGPPQLMERFADTLQEVLDGR